jgi:hypothetical protein
MPNYLSNRVPGTFDARVTGLGRFGEVLTAPLSPASQLTFSYGVPHEKMTQFTLLGGTLAVSENKLQATCGGTVGSTAFARADQYTAYRAGQGVLGRFTAIFDVSNATTGVSQVVGLFGGAESGLFFGYNYVDNEFGVCHQTGGVREFQTLTVTVGAAGNETATVTLNHITFDVALTVGNTTVTAEQLALATDTYTLWGAHAIGPDVYFLSDNAGDKTGTFSISSTGTATGSFVETAAGVAATNTWTKQADWNRRVLDGTDGDFVLDPSKGNIYEIRFAYLGYAGIEYCINDPVSGEMLVVHRNEYPNSSADVNISQPNLAPGLAATCLSSTASVTIQTPSLSSFIEGASMPDGPNHGTVTTGTANTTDTPLLAIRNTPVFANRANLRQVLPARLFISATGGNKSMIITLRRSCDLVGAQWSEYEAGDSLVHVDTAATSHTGGDTLAVIALANGDTMDVDLNHLGLHPGEKLVVHGYVTGNNMDYVVCLAWQEDI